MFFRFAPFEAPAAFHFTDPDTGAVYSEPDKISLMNRIRAYRAQNNLEEIEHLGFVLESYWCGLPENEGKCVPVEMTPRGTLGFLKGGIALLKTMLYGSFAPQWAADKRSEQCSACKFNVFPDKGAFVKWSDDIAKASVEGRKSIHHDELGTCAVCSCPLRAKVFYEGSVELDEAQAVSMREVSCWQLSLRKKNG